MLSPPTHVTTWRCDANASVSASAMPIVVYMLGAAAHQSGARSARSGKAVCSVFEFERASLSTIFLITDNTVTSVPTIAGAFGRYRPPCAFESTSPMPSPDVLTRMLNSIPASARKGHAVDIAPLAIAKLELLRHLPSSLQSVALLDADTLCVKCDDLRKVRDSMRASSSSAFLAASVSGARVWATAEMRVAFEGINSGVLVLHLSRLRAFARRVCPNHAPHAWHTCVLDSVPAATADWRMTDQAIWNRLIEMHPQVYRQLSCGLHSEGAVLLGAASRVGLGRPNWARVWSTPVAATQTGTPSAGDGAATREPAPTPIDDCDPSTRVRTTRAATFGEVARAAVGVAPRVAVLHGAGGNKFLARAVARKLSSMHDA